MNEWCDCGAFYPGDNQRIHIHLDDNFVVQCEKINDDKLCITLDQYESNIYEDLVGSQKTFRLILPGVKLRGLIGHEFESDDFPELNIIADRVVSDLVRLRVSNDG